jgi:hypothetical protein
MRLNGSSIYSKIALTENKFVPKEVQILRVGKFNHPTYGAFEITPLTLFEMKSNFDSNIRGVDMAFDYFHDSDKEASAWVKSLELRENNTELWALVDWTPKAEQKLSERELRYFSPDFAFNWTDPEKGATYNNVLFGGGLTNRPFVKEMKAIVANEGKMQDASTQKEIELGGPGSGPQKGGGAGKAKDATHEANKVAFDKADKAFKAHHSELVNKYNKEGDYLRDAMTPEEHSQANALKAERLKHGSAVHDKSPEDFKATINKNSYSIKSTKENGYSPEKKAAKRPDYKDPVKRKAAMQARMSKQNLKQVAAQKKSDAIKKGIQERKVRVNQTEQLQRESKARAAARMAKSSRSKLSEIYLQLKLNKGVEMTDLEMAQARIKELEAHNIKLAEDNSEVEKMLADMPTPQGDTSDSQEEGDEIEMLKKQIEELQAKLAKAEGDMQVMAGEKAKADEAKMLAEKESAFSILLAEGKACVAQKAAFIKSDMAEFVKLAQPLNMKASGSSTSTAPGEDDVKAILKLAEEKQKSNPKLNRGDAISLAKRELKN